MTMRSTTRVLFSITTTAMVTLGASGYGCGGPAGVEGPQEQLPSCISSMVAQLPTDCTDSVTRYQYHDEAVYVFDGTCLDAYAYVYDSTCEEICALGGMTGRGDGRCPDFYDEATDRAVVWPVWPECE